MSDTWKGEERRKSHMVCDLHCLVAQKIVDADTKILSMHKAIFGTDEDPTTGLYWMAAQNNKFISLVSRVFWPLVISSLIGVSSAFVLFIRDVFLHIKT
jgi:hypothetical protein